MSSPLSKKKSPKTTRPLELADRLHSVSIHLLRQLRREDEVSGLGPARLSALSVIVFGGPLTLGALARAEQVQPPTMSRLVRGLERAGLIRRLDDARDGRRVRIEATAKGRRLLESGRTRRVAALRRQFRTLPRTELSALTRATAILEKLLEGWRSS